jgi:hypothetical protein
LIDVVKPSGEKETGWPASGAAEAQEATAPYQCSLCGGPGFYFYREDDAGFGESLRLDELPADAEVGGVSGTPEWVARHSGKPANFIWRGPHT